SAQFIGADFGRRLFDSRARRRAGFRAAHLGGAFPQQGGQPVHRAQPEQAAKKSQPRSIGRNGARPPEASRFAPPVADWVLALPAPAWQCIPSSYSRSGESSPTKTVSYEKKNIPEIDCRLCRRAYALASGRIGANCIA